MHRCEAPQISVLLPVELVVLTIEAADQRPDVSEHEAAHLLLRWRGLVAHLVLLELEGLLLLSLWLLLLSLRRLDSVGDGGALVEGLGGVRLRAR